MKKLLATLLLAALLAACDGSSSSSAPSHAQPDPYTGPTIVYWGQNGGLGIPIGGGFYMLP